MMAKGRTREGAGRTWRPRYSVCASYSIGRLPKETLLVQPLPFCPSWGYPRNKGRRGKGQVLSRTAALTEPKTIGSEAKTDAPGCQSSLHTRS